MYKVIKVDDDIVYVINLENNKPMKLNKSKIDWDVKVNDYIDFYFVDDKVIVIKIDKEHISPQETKRSTNINKIAISPVLHTAPQKTKQSNLKTLTQPRIKKEAEKLSSSKWAGIILGLIFNIFGLFIGLIVCRNKEYREEFVSGWFHIFLVFIIIPIALLLLVYIILSIFE